MKSLFAVPVLACAVSLCGCRSAKPKPEPPLAVTRAERSMSQAQELSLQQNWSAAAAEWKKAADEASLLNDRTNEAVALHNLANAQRHLNQYDTAISNATGATELNAKLDRTDEWWRNQILLLQLEALSTNSSLAARFDQLLPRLAQVNDPAIRGAVWNELGLSQHRAGELNKALESLSRAQAQYQAAKDAAGVATAIANRAKVLESQREFEQAIPAWADALQRFQRLADPVGIAHSLLGHGRTLLAAKRDLPLAEEHLRRAARNFRSLKLDAEAARATELLTQVTR
jgi:tetratricopeptide (TPR) repeat protein